MDKYCSIMGVFLSFVAFNSLPSLALRSRGIEWAPWHVGLSHWLRSVVRGRLQRVGAHQILLFSHQLVEWLLFSSWFAIVSKLNRIFCAALISSTNSVSFLFSLPFLQSLGSAEWLHLVQLNVTIFLILLLLCASKFNGSIFSPSSFTGTFSIRAEKVNLLMIRD